jgi:hypothetical protein
MIEAANVAIKRPEERGFCQDDKVFIERICLPHVFYMINAAANFDPFYLHRVTGQYFTVFSENFAARITWFPLLRESESQKLLQRCEILPIRMMAQTLLLLTH